MSEYESKMKCAHPVDVIYDASDHLLDKAMSGEYSIRDSGAFLRAIRLLRDFADEKYGDD